MAGRVEFTSFLPENTQAAIVQPIGNDGVLIAASNTQRGFTRLDQVLHITLQIITGRKQEAETVR